jgi:phage shock protein C
MIFSSLLIGALLFVGPALAAIAVRRSLNPFWQAVFVGLCLLYAVLPLLIASVGASLAEAHGCVANAALYECPSNPGLSDQVTAMTFAHWGAIITIPSGLAGVIGLLIYRSSQSNRSRSQASTPGESRAFYRSRHRKVLAGVCAAIAQRWGVPLLALRIGFVAVSLVMPGLGLMLHLLYLWLWLAVPMEPAVRTTELR